MATLPTKAGVTRTGGGAGAVRIIGGQWRRRLLPVASSAGLRPTPNRVRETLFNWLGQSLVNQSVVDAFAGSGALGFEAASRGALAVLLCEQDATLARSLLAVRAQLQAHQVEISHGDALIKLAALAAQSVDVVFIDPPFESKLYVPALRAAARIVKCGAWVYVESHRTWTPSEFNDFGFRIYRQGKAGLVIYYLLQKDTLRESKRESESKSVGETEGSRQHE